MRGNIGDKERLLHIKESITHIESFVEGLNYEEYSKNFMLRLALVKLFEIIGEAATKLSDELKVEFSDIEWATLKGLRNILVHEYFGIDYKTIWESIQRDIPALKIKIDAIIVKHGYNS
jgi:uncharacterized protein with HEPN domain